MSVAVPLPSVDVPHGSASSGKENQRMLASAPPMDPYFVPQLEADQLKSVIEYFLSRTYLEGDPYLVSQMNTDLYLPVELLVERISTFVCPTEFADVISAIESSKEVSLDASKTLVRPNFKLARNTIILRDLTGITEKEVNDLFPPELPFKPTEITKEVGDCWFVAFDSEANALTALTHVRQQKYNGVPIHARLKQESLLRSSNAIDAVSMAYYPEMYYGMIDYDLQAQYENDPSSDAHRSGPDGKDSQRRNHRFGGRGGRFNRKGRDFNPNANSNSQPNSNNNTSSSGPNADGTGRHGGYGGHRNKGRHANTGRKRVNSGKRGTQASINLGLAHFPPLHAQDQKAAKASQSVKKWSKQEIVDIIKTLGENPPRSSELPADCIAILATPNVTLDVLKPFPKVETIDLSKVSKGPDYKAVVAKPTTGNTDAQKGAKAAKNVAKPPAAAASAEKSHDKPNEKSHEKGHDKKKGQKGKKAPNAGHGKPKEAEKKQPTPTPAPAAAPLPTESAAPSTEVTTTEHERRSEADVASEKLSWARRVAKPADTPASTDGSSDAQ